MNPIRKFAERSLIFETAEYEKLVKDKEPVPIGGTKEVYRTHRNNYIKTGEKSLVSDSTFNDLKKLDRTAETWKQVINGEKTFKQERVPKNFEQALIEYGLDYCIEETTKIFEEFREHGYIFCDLNPDNIAFKEDYAVAIDFLDNNAVKEGIDDKEFEAALQFDFFADELAFRIPSLEKKEVQKYVESHIEYLNFQNNTGNILNDYLL